MRVDPASVAETNISLLQLKIKPGGSHGNISHAFIFKHSRSPPPAHQLKINTNSKHIPSFDVNIIQYLCQVRWCMAAVGGWEALSAWQTAASWRLLAQNLLIERGEPHHAYRYRSSYPLVRLWDHFIGLHCMDSRNTIEVDDVLSFCCESFWKMWDLTDKSKKGNTFFTLTMFTFTIIKIYKLHFKTAYILYTVYLCSFLYFEKMLSNIRLQAIKNKKINKIFLP
jgi:hypothetical protein